MSAPQRSPEWLAERRGLITCSRLWSAIRHHKSYWLELIGLNEPFYGKVPSTEYGNDCEQEALSEYEAETGNIVLPCGFIKHPTIAWLGGSPDGRSPGRLQEFKCLWTAPIPEKPKKEHFAQCQGNMACAGEDVVDLYYWTPQQTRLFVIERDREWWGDAYPKLESFWQKVVKREWT